jgi:hypothetical protein
MSHEILTIPVTPGVPFDKPKDQCQFLAAAYLGSQLVLYYQLFAEANAVEYVSAVVKTVDLCLDSRVPDGFRYLSAVKRDHFNENLVLFIRQ